MGMNLIVVNWILIFVESSSFAILVNGVPYIFSNPPEGSDMDVPSPTFYSSLWKRV